MIRKAKLMYWKTTFDQAKTDIKLTWKNINIIIGKTNNKPSLPTIFYYNGLEYTNTSDIAQGFNEYFVKIGSNLASKIPK